MQVKEKGKEKEKKEKQSKDLDSNLLNIVRPEGEFEIPIGDGKRRKVFWARSGFDNKVYYRAYFKRRLKEAVDCGLMVPEGKFKGTLKSTEGAKNTFALEPASLVDGTLKVYVGSTLKEGNKDYTYSPDLRVLFFGRDPIGTVTVEYDYYDLEIYDQLFNDSFVIALIFLCARNAELHKERIFKTVDDIGSMTMVEIGEIINLFNDKYNLTEKELKNSSTPPTIVEEDNTQNAGS